MYFSFVYNQGLYEICQPFGKIFCPIFAVVYFFVASLINVYIYDTWTGGVLSKGFRINKALATDQMNECIQILHNKPKFTWLQHQRPNQMYSLNECEICIENFKNHEWITVLPCQGKHFFHFYCLITYFDLAVKSKLVWKHRCPLCFEEITNEKL